MAPGRARVNPRARERGRQFFPHGTCLGLGRGTAVRDALSGQCRLGPQRTQGLVFIFPTRAGTLFCRCVRTQQRRQCAGREHKCGNPERSRTFCCRPRKAFSCNKHTMDRGSIPQPEKRCDRSLLDQDFLRDRQTYPQHKHAYPSAAPATYELANQQCGSAASFPGLPARFHIPDRTSTSGATPTDLLVPPVRFSKAYKNRLSPNPVPVTP